MSGTRVTCTDEDTGESDTKHVENDFLLVTDGTCYLASAQHYPTKGTTVLTVKMEPPKGQT